MPRIKKGRRNSNACGTCLIVCSIIIVLLIVGVAVGSVVAFNSFVSPLIGGVKFGDCLSILSTLRRADRNKIIDQNEEFSSQDLNDFYYSLNSMLYQKDMTEEEYVERYESLSEEEKASMTFEEYKNANPYRINLNVLFSALNLDDLISGGNSSEEEPEVSAAMEIDDSEQNVEESDNEAYINLIKEMYFDFSALGKYPYLQDEEDFSYTTFEITGKQLASVVNEIMDKFLKSLNLGANFQGLEDVNLKDYFGIPVVSFKNQENKDKLVMTVELKLKKFTNEVLYDILVKQMNVPKFAVNVVKSIIPNNFFATLESYPTDENSEIYLKINNANEKTSKNIMTITNALTQRFNVNLFPNSDSSENDTPEENSENDTIFKQINNKIVDVFSLINDYVPVNFVSDSEGSSTLRVAHIQSLLKMTGLFDENDLENSVTPHMFFTTLRCLFDEASAVSNKEDLITLYLQLDEKYGIDENYWTDKSLLSPDTLQNITSQIDVSTVEYKDNENMRVYIHDGQLTNLINQAIKNGSFLNTDNEVVQAGEDENQNSILSKVDFEAVKISKSSSQLLSSYTKNETVYTNARSDIYSIDATVSLTLSDLLTSNDSENEEGKQENPILETLTKSLPEKLCLALVLNIKDVFDENGNLIDRIVGAEVMPTTFKINNFDENYSKKVFDIITLMVSKFNSEFNLDINKITSQIETSFENVFTQVSDNLYCDIYFSENDENNAKTGCLVLPSVYEVVKGLSDKEIENSDSLTVEDSLSKEEIKDLFVQIYNTRFLVLDYNQNEPDDTTNYEKVLRKFDPNEGNDFLARLSRNYYFKNPLNSESLFGDEKIDFSASSFVFKGENGLYLDKRDISELDTKLNGGALASIINDGVDLANLITQDGEGENLIKSLSIINCEYEWVDEVLYLNFEFVASMKENTAGAEDNENGASSISLDSFLPEKAYLTACIVLHTTEEGDLYNTELLLNNGGLTSISKLAKIFSGGNFATDTLNGQIKESLSKTFDSIKDIFNLKYVKNSDDAVVFKNVFNTINKLSHPDSETDDAKHNDHVAYEALSEEEKEADDLALRNILQEFGRAPKYTSNFEYDKETEVKILNNVENLTYFSNDENDIYSLTDLDSFFTDLNNNFYISDENLLNADNITELKSIPSTFVDFKKLYNDERDISDINLFITGNRFTALANKFTGYSIALKNSNGNDEPDFGQALLAQSRIGIEENISFLEIIILVEISSNDELLSAVLPDHIFLTAKLDLSAADENGKNTYPLDLFINNFRKEETDDTMRRLNLLENALNFKTGFELEQVKTNLSDNISSVLSNYSELFDGFNIKDGYIDLPNIYEYITNGTIESDGHYNKEKPMYETFVSNGTKRIYGVENGKVGYYENNNFILINAFVDGNETEALATRNADDILGYYDGGNFVAIQTLPEELMFDLRNFGKTIGENKINLPLGSNLGYYSHNYNGEEEFISKTSTEIINIYQPTGLTLALENDYFLNSVTDANGNYYYDSTGKVLKDINLNFYIKDSKAISISNFMNQDEKMKLDNQMFDFEMLYRDKRAFEDLSINVKGNDFASIVHDMYPNGFTSELNENYSANIVQMHIYTKDLSENDDNLLSGYTTLKTVLRVTLTNRELNNVNILPEYLYLTVYTILDEDAGDKRFECEIVLNNFGNEETANAVKGFENTQTFIDRLNVLKNNFNVNFNFDFDEIKDTVKKTFSSLFEDNLQTFGNLKYENDSLIIPNLFQLLTEGQIIDDGTGSLSYINGIEIKEGVEIDHRMYEKDGSLTSPEILRDRMKELGNNTYTGAIPVRGQIDVFYNDNVYTKNDEELFYSDMQALYFLKNKPTLDDLKNSTILDSLTSDIENVFNLRGIDGAVYGEDIKQNYIDFGLYNYLGEQEYLRMSDKALASLIGSQSTITMSPEMMLKDLTITSIKINDHNENSTTIEITIKATTRHKVDTELNAMPDYFYLTAITERTIVSGVVDYESRIAINGFTPDELDSFLTNIAHIEEYSSLGISENFKTSDIASAVESALRDTLDSNLSQYIDSFGNYDNSESGKGYIQFKSIYSELLKYTNATSGNETDMQNVIVKLNNNDSYLSKNKFNESNALSISDLFVRKYFTDREFAYMLNSLLKADSSTSYINVEQIVILKGENIEYQGYLDLIRNVKKDFELTNEDSGYYLVTVAINASEITSSVKLAPEIIHISLLMDSQGNFVKYNDTNGEKSVKFIQNFSASEQALFMSIFNDTNDNINVDAKIEEKVKSILTYASNTTLNQSDNFDECCGYVGTKE